MEQIIVYGSCYGTTKAYALELSRLTGIEALSHADAPNLAEFNQVVLLGALYAGGVVGLKNILKSLSSNARLIVATVGLADVDDQENISNIHAALEKQIPKDVLARTTVFHLRGGIDYGKLGMKHKAMMSLLHSKIKKMPEEQLSADSRAIIETYNKQVDFTNFETLQPIVQAMAE